MIRLHPRDRRAIGVGAAVLFVAFAATRGLPAWWQLLERARDTASAELRAVRDARAVIAAAEVLEDSLRVRRARYVAATPMLVLAGSPSDAASRLSAVVSDAARNAGVAMSSVTLRADTSTASTFGRPRLRGEARGDISGLSQFLLLIEGGPTLLRVIDLTVTQPDPVGGARPEELRFSFTIEALARTERHTNPKGAT